MKKIGTYFLIILLSIIVFLLGFNHKSSIQPKTYYNVYLDDEFIGVIESKEKLEEYINKQGDSIRENVREYTNNLDAIQLVNDLSTKVTDITDKLELAKYAVKNEKKLNLSDMDVDNLNYYIDNELYKIKEKEIKEMEEYKEENSIYSSVEKIYTPNGIEIKKTYTYKDEVISVPEAYKRIIAKKSCTIAGYKFVIKGTDDKKEDLVIYTTDTKIFSDAIEDLITIFVKEEDYEAYKKDIQSEITDTGSLIENIYVEQEITYKAANVSVEEKIYTDSKDLSAYLLYGEGFEQKTVTVKPGDSIESISFDNQISVQEFLIFNDKYTSRDNLLVPNTEVIISKVAPKIEIVVERFEIVDKETPYSVVEQYDENLSQGSVMVAQEGENGIDRVSQHVKSVNGEITYVDPAGKETIKNSISKIISIGTRYVPSVGSTIYWEWPTNGGYTISSYYGYRLAVFGEGNFHTGIDIAGTGYGSPVRAANNGVITEMTYLYSNGNYIVIDHNNGFYTMYAHMANFASNISIGSTVARGQTIGYVGSTGWSTGPHLHFEIRTCPKYSCHTNPLRFF